MPEIVNKCLLCHGTHSQLFDLRTFAGHVVENRICQSCGFVYQSPRMTAAEANDFYTAEYRKLYQGSSAPNPKDLTVQSFRAESLASFTKKHVKQIERLLDIGCSAGLLLRALNQSFGCIPVGIEPGVAYREYAAQYGFKTYTSLYELQIAEEVRFDLISMAHVLEHIPDPLAYLAALREQYLTSDGWLLLEVPNLYMHDSFEFAHLSSFSPHTLRQMVINAGFEIVVMEKHGRPRSGVLPYYLTLLCRPVSNKGNFSLLPESAVRFKRRMGLLYRQVVSRFLPASAWKSYTDTKE